MMKKYTLLLLIILVGFFPNYNQAQELTLTAKDSIVTSYWFFGLGINIVDDSATPFGRDFLNIDDTWNMVPYPSSVSVGRAFKNGLRATVIGSYTEYRVGKKIDGRINETERDYVAIDGMLSYDLNKIIGETGWFDPFIQIGAGYTSIGSIGRTTANAGFGFNTWFNDRWGLNFHTMGKWGLGEDQKSTKQLQHTAGVVYRFGVEKEISKKGLEKLALLEENQRVQDSIDAAHKAEEEARLLAERLAHEKEKARLAALEKEKADAERRKEQLQNEIRNLGNVYFDFNSSYLNKPYKELLDKLTVLMENNPALHIKVTSHTDSRGPETYNMWLSERRVNRTVDYLLAKGLPENRISKEAFGETQLLNECDDHTRCTEQKHAVNRRSEFEIIGF
ncbi:OmpA family protein [Arenibacter sp. GZD96]|uniref:OmpA family protein n=1 Tax=Aurantibrevibacter litoralis TaxID=3106030 RepID=UPI002AFFEBD6|nr:OmpA family protein [Arenibacter sp. GZD-96]MEA1787392.1 OmpA family protein [Arenibacter sp. GZD-96]